MFSPKEQKVALQCIWQVLQARPTEEESLFVENLVNNWNCMQNVDLSNLAFIRMAVDVDVKPWIVVAVEEDPFETFSTVTDFSFSQKEELKKLILNIIEKCSDYSARAPYAHTLFERCSIPFKVVPKIFGNKVFYRLA